MVESVQEILMGYGRLVCLLCALAIPPFLKFFFNGKNTGELTIVRANLVIDIIKRNRIL